MKQTITRCDCCGKSANNTFELVLPIIHIGVDDNQYALPQKVDVCEKCTCRFLYLYYQIASENNFSGIRAIDMGGDL